MAKKTTKNSNENKVSIIIKGEIRGVFDHETKGTHPKDKRVCYRHSIKNGIFKDVDKMHQIVEMYDLDDQYTPKWIKELAADPNFCLPEFINFKSDYPMVFRDAEDNIIDPSEVLSGALGYFNVVFKELNDGAIGSYCTAFKMLEQGEQFNPFADANF